VLGGSLGFYPRGQWFWGTIVVAAFAFSDMLDGAVARVTGRTGVWGAFLDSTLDRFGDAAVFGGIALFYAGRGHDLLLCCVALACLVFASLTSYIKARAEGLGLRCDVGLAERSERLVVILLCTGLSGLLDEDWIRIFGLWFLAGATLVTVGQRLLFVRQQAFAVTPT
jgi:phosphatidylglycerophosphate synthase